MDWAASGFEGSKLGYLVGQCGWFHQGHRAIDDCHALLEVLAHLHPEERGSGFGQLITRSRTVGMRISAEGAPFELKDQLKRRGYR